MKARFPGFIGPSYTLQSVNVDCQRALNLFPEVNDLGTGKEREPASLVPTPGLRGLIGNDDNGPGGVRCLYRASTDRLFTVVGNNLKEITTTTIVGNPGSIHTSYGPVSMADNGTHLVIVDGLNGYVYNMDTAAFETITDDDFPDGVTQVAYLDGYFVFITPDSQQFFFSALDDVTFDSLDVGVARGSPDRLVGLIASAQNLFLFGTQSTEVFYDSGDADDPFQRVSGAVVDVGCAAPFSIAKLPGGGLAWLGGDEHGAGIVYQMTGYQAKRVSTFAIEELIRGLTGEQIAAARAWCYQQGGHGFYVLNIPGLSTTWVYDVSTGLWHERSFRGNDGQEQRHRADCHAVFDGVNVVGDYENGNIYALDPQRYGDYVDLQNVFVATLITRERVAPHISKTGNFTRHNAFELDMETGVGLDGGVQGSNPTATLFYSDDGGTSWRSAGSRSIGAIGERKKRPVWRRLGSARDRVYKVRITDPVKTVLIGANLDLEEGVA